jgi:hypothetical protein
MCDRSVVPVYGPAEMALAILSIGRLVNSVQVLTWWFLMPLRGIDSCIVSV